MSFTPADLPDMRGRTVVVTGANSGLGLETARLLAGAGATVVMTARTEAKFEAARDEILPTNRRADLRFVSLDLADLASVRDAAAQVAAEHEAIDVLVNNAGIMMTPQATTADGFELQLGTNHLGHFALTGLLLDRLLAADAGRVVTVASGVHHQGRVDLDDLHYRTGGYTPQGAYARSKLANVLFFLELQRRFEASGVAAISVGAHPGYTDTNLQSTGVSMAGGSLWHRVVGLAMKVTNPLLGMDVAQGALPQVFAAVGDVPGGSYWGPQGPMEARGPVGRAKINPKGRDESAARGLWTASVEATGVDYAVLAPPAA